MVQPKIAQHTWTTSHRCVNDCLASECGEMRESRSLPMIRITEQHLLMLNSLMLKNLFEMVLKTRLLKTQSTQYRC